MRHGSPLSEWIGCATLMWASAVSSEARGWGGGRGCATLMGASEVTSETRGWEKRLCDFDGGF